MHGEDERQRVAGRWWVAGLVLVLVGGVGWDALAAGAVGSPRGSARPLAPLQATRQPPAGQWRLVHGPGTAPLWGTTGPVLRAVQVVDTAGGRVGYAVGAEGSLARLDGQAWQKVGDLDPKKTSPLTYDLQDVFIVAPDDVWVVAAMTGDRFCQETTCGALLHYDGQRWQAIDKTTYGLPGQVPPMRGIDMLANADGAWFGWIVGDDLTTDTLKALIMRYKDGKWRVWGGPNNLARNLHDVKLVSPAEAWLVGEFGVESWYTESEAGVGTWAPLGKSGSDDLFALDLADPRYGWDGGDGGRMNRYTGSCHEPVPDDNQCWFYNQARPIRDARGSVVSQDVLGIDLLSRDEGWLVGAASARQSLVAYLEPLEPEQRVQRPWPRESWRTVTVANDPGTTLRGLHMVDSRLGFAVGEKGVILEYHDDTVPTATPTDDAPPTATPSPTATATIVASPTDTLVAPDTPTPTAVPASATVTPSPQPGHTPTVTPSPSSVPATATATPEAAAIYLPWAWRPKRP